MVELPRVKDVMATNLLTLEETTDILDAVDLLLKHAISGAPVLDSGGQLVGVISEKDCLKLIAEGVNAEPPHGTVGEFMSRDVVTVPPEMDAYYAAGRFLKESFRRFPVVDEAGKLVGQLSRRDLLRVLQGMLRQV